jgi:mycothiol system anti-sigma-R factor
VALFEDDCDCDDILRDVELYLDGELGPEDTPRVTEHLQECSPCMGKAEFRRDLKALISRKCGCEVPPAGLMEKIKAQLESQPGLDA